MSKVQRRKHVLKEMMADNFELPQPQQKIVRVLGSRGNNLHEVETAEPEAERFLVSMPCKFRKNIWAQRNKFVLVEPIAEGRKVKAEIYKILMAEDVAEYKKAGVWPFPDKCASAATKKDLVHDENDDDDEDEGFVVRNLNRAVVTLFKEDTDSSSDDDDISDDDDDNSDDNDENSDDDSSYDDENSDDDDDRSSDN